MEREKRVAFLTIHDIWFDTEQFQSCKDRIVALHTNDVLKEQDYDFKILNKTFLLNITDELKDIFAKFEYKSARYAINRAIRDGVSVRRVINDVEIDQYMAFQAKFCKQKGIPLANREEIEKLTCYYAVSKDNEYLGACAFLEAADRKTVRYKYGATLHKLNANEIIIWQAIQDYHNAGYLYFDFGGCVPTENKESYYYRHYRFKKKFGGSLIDSYTYFRIKGIYRIFYYIFRVIVILLFKGDVNGFTNWLNQKGFLK